MSAETPAELNEALDELHKATVDARNWVINESDSRSYLQARERREAARAALVSIYNKQREAYSVCPNCNTSWTGAEIQSEIDRQREELVESEAELASAREWNDRLARPLAKARAENASLSSQLERLKADSEACARDLSDAWEEIRRLRHFQSGGPDV